MPIYEYACDKCGQKIEVIQKFSDPDLDKHEACGGTLTKLISAAGFQFKGSGWYITDYARKGRGADTAEKSEKSDKSDKSGKKEGAASTEGGSGESSKSKTPAASGPRNSGNSGAS